MPHAARAYLPFAVAFACVVAYLDDTFALCRTDDDCEFASAKCAEFARAVGLRLNLKPGKTEAVRYEDLCAGKMCVEMLGAHFGDADAITRTLEDAVASRRPILERLERWYRAGQAHGALAVLRVCELPSRSHTARCEVPSQAIPALREFASRVLGTLGRFLDTPSGVT